MHSFWIDSDDFTTSLLLIHLGNRDIPFGDAFWPEALLYRSAFGHDPCRLPAFEQLRSADRSTKLSALSGIVPPQRTDKATACCDSSNVRDGSKAGSAARAMRDPLWRNADSSNHDRRRFSAGDRITIKGLFAFKLKRDDPPHPPLAATARRRRAQPVAEGVEDRRVGRALERHDAVDQIRGRIQAQRRTPGARQRCRPARPRPRKRRRNQRCFCPRNRPFQIRGTSSGGRS